MVRALTDIEVLSRDLTTARARIAELEDWQRRAVACIRGAVDCDCALECAYIENSCGWCRNRDQLLSEVKP